MSDLEGPDTSFGVRFPKTRNDISELVQSGREKARDLGEFLDASPTPYHAVREVRRRLERAGFREVLEADVWKLGAGDRIYVVRGGTTILAAVVGTKNPSDVGFRLVGAHTDSPNLRVKPNPELVVRGYEQVGVEIYGGALLSTWLDRDLSVAGRVLFDDGGFLRSELVNFEAPVARIPNLAIHLNRQVNTEGLILNAQRHMVPVVGLGDKATFRTRVAALLSIKPEQIRSYDLCLYDTVKASLAGMSEEFIFSARLDNLASCHTSLSALLAAPENVEPTRVLVFYDHEECGSKSALGAAGTVLKDMLGRLEATLSDRTPQGFQRAMAKSRLISADMAHAVHPNYTDLHDSQHAPSLNRGLVIKSNSNQSYATDGMSSAWFEMLCDKVGYSPQRFVVRSDLPCGSTIGPITSAELGISTVDVGAPMLSMHSCREMAGTLDVHLSIETMRHFFST